MSTNHNENREPAKDENKEDSLRGPALETAGLEGGQLPQRMREAI